MITLEHAAAQPKVGLRTAAQPAAIDDRRWLATAALGMLVLCGLPYLVAAAFGPPDLQRLGTFWFVRDFSQYQAAMRDGATQPGWLIHSHFSAEPHAPALMYPLYVGIGKLAGLLRLDPLVIFSLAEWLGRLSLVGSIYAFAAAFTDDRRARRLAVLLATGTLGLGALLIPFHLSGVVTTPIDVYLETNSFGLFLAGPHLMFGMALTLACAPLYLRARQTRGIWVAALGAAVLGLSLVHPFNVPVLLSVLGLHAALGGRRAWLAAGVAAMAAAPMVVYTLLTFRGDPFWSATYGSTQNLMPASPPWWLIVDFGLLLLAAPMAWPMLRTWSPERRWLVLLWVGVGLVWMYAPVPFQRRLGFGVQPGLAVLAAAGLLWLQQQRLPGLRRRLINYAVMFLAVCTSALVYVALLVSAVTNRPVEVYVWTTGEAAAATWIGQHSTADDVVLASTKFANPLAGGIDGRVVHGHIVATRDSPTKSAWVDRFYAADTPAVERSAILRETRATLVAFGPHERELGATDLRAMPELAAVYDVDGVQVFRVQR